MHTKCPDLKKKKIKFRTDYEIFRYVDDYFVFYNEEKTKDEILREYKCQLKIIFKKDIRVEIFHGIEADRTTISLIS